MKRKALFPLFAFGVAAVVAVVANAGPPDGPQFGNVATANTEGGRVRAGVASRQRARPDRPRPGLAELENPHGIVTHYGYENDVPSPRDPTVPLMVGFAPQTTEAQKTEPDKNTYLVLPGGQPGADPNYDYGTHFLFQGHEGAASVNGQKQGYITSSTSTPTAITG